MIVRIVVSMVIAGVLVLGVGAADVRAQSTGCAQVRAANLLGGRFSAEELASKLKIDVETVRDCLNKPPTPTLLNKAPAPTGQATPPTVAPAAPPPAAGARAQSSGCAQIRVANQLSGGRFSAEELASKLKTDVETVRDCLNKAPAPTGQATPPTAAPAAPPPTAPATRY